MKEEILNKIKKIRYDLAAELKNFIEYKFKELKKELGFANGGVVDHGKLKQSMGKTSHDFNPVGLQNIEVKDCTKLEVEKLLKIFKKKQEIYKFNRDNSSTKSAVKFNEGRINAYQDVIINLEQIIEDSEPKKTTYNQTFKILEADSVAEKFAEHLEKQGIDKI